MLISKQWIESLLGLEQSEVPSSSKFSALLTGLGLEVESIREVGRELEGVRVGEIRAVTTHPKAERLSVVQLFDGSEVLQVVCGASNLPATGGKVAYAPVGTRLPNGMDIGARDIRGVHSLGMICSEAELDIGPDASGIVVLPLEWAAGSHLVDHVPGIVDTVLELSITPNRPDALGHIGVARDVGAKTGRPLRLLALDLPGVGVASELVTLHAADRCGRYLGFAFDRVQVGTSPLWLRVRLHRLGLRPINNVVDITNYVMMECGQPLHAFDRKRLDQGRVVVRMASDAEPLTTLDGREVELSMDDLVIADASRPQALAGIMGGEHSGVDETTQTLLLEVAWFQPTGIRRSARRHAFSSDSSHRFERGVDHEWGLEYAAARACALLQQLTSAQCVGASKVDGQLPRAIEIELRLARAQALIGMELDAKECRGILAALGIEISADDGQAWRCVAPSFRPDLLREEDLIEELLRVIGLDKLPSTPTLPSCVTPPATRAAGLELRERLLDALREFGLHECISLVFEDPQRLAGFADGVGPERWVKIRNPLRLQASVLRTHLLPGLLDALATNLARHANPVRLFELGRVYAWPPAGVTPMARAEGPTAHVDAQLPAEPLRAGILLCDGVRRQPRGESGRGRIDAHDVAGIVLRVLERVGYAAELLPVDAPNAALHPGVQARVSIRTEQDARIVGACGEVHPELIERWQLGEGLRVYYAEIEAEQLPPSPIGRYRALPRFPATNRDVSLELPRTLPASVLIDAVHEAAAALTLETPREGATAPADLVALARGDSGEAAVDVIDDYRGDGVAPDMRALLLRLSYRATDRTVTDDEVDELHERIVSRVVVALRDAAPNLRRR